MSSTTAKRINLNRTIKIIRDTPSGFIKPTKPLIVHTEEYIEIIKPKDIFFIKAEGNYSSIELLCGRKILASKTMGSFEKQLPEQLFLRCHQSYLINRSAVNRIKKSPSVVLCLSDGREIPVSRSKKKEVIDQLTNF